MKVLHKVYDNAEGEQEREHNLQIQQIFNLFTEKKEWILSDTDFTVLTMKK